MITVAPTKESQVTPNLREVYPNPPLKRRRAEEEEEEEEEWGKAEQRARIRKETEVNKSDEDYGKRKREVFYLPS
jgi:hypothetical protein